jgi:hypothetical protein
LEEKELVQKIAKQRFGDVLRQKAAKENAKNIQFEIY